MPELSRRSLVRASAGALWVAPVITVATSAPARACSGDTCLSLVLGSSMAWYAGDPARPDRIAVGADIENTSAATAIGLLAVQLGLGLGMARLTDGSTANTVTFPISVSPGETLAFRDVVELADTTDNPYIGYRGSGGELTFSLLMGGEEPVPDMTSVDPMGEPSIASELSASTVSDGQGLLRLNVTGLAVPTTCLRGIGQVRAEFMLQKSMGTVTVTAPPIVGTVTPPGVWGAPAVVDREDSWVIIVETTEEGFAGGLVAAETERGPVALHTVLDLGVPGDLNGYEFQWRFEAEGMGVILEPPPPSGS